LNCSAINEKLYDYIEGNLEKEEECFIAQHLKTCAACKQHYEEKYRMLSSLKRYGETLPDTTIDAELLFKMTEEKSVKKKSSLKRVASYAAVFVLGIMIPLIALMLGGANSDLLYDQGNYESMSSQNNSAKGQDNPREESGEQTDRITGLSQVYAPEKIIYNMNMDLQVENYAKARDDVVEYAVFNGGYIENEDKNNYSNNGVNYYYGYFVIRIPAENYEQFCLQMEDVGTVTNSSAYAANITQEYIDAEANVEQLNVQRDRLLKLYDQAETVSDLIEIESELTRLNTQIVQWENMLKDYDRDVAHSTVTLNISEATSSQLHVTNPFKGLGARIKLALVKSVNGFLDSVGFLFVGLFYVLPFVILAFVIVLIVRRRRKNKVMK
jgi:hypothetical protein